MTADANGNIRDQFNLPDWFVAVYSVTATGATSGTVTTSFTDARLVTSATLNGGSSVSVQPGDSITANVTVQRDGTGINARWNSTGWRVNTTAPGSVTCVNLSNHETNAVPAVTDSESFSITAPNAPGTYNAYFVAYSTDNCRAQGGTNGAPSATFMISNGVVVKSNQETLTYTGPTTGTYGDKLTLSSSGGSGTGAVTYETTGTACELGTGADAGKLLITSGTGTCSVTVNKAADNNYKDATSGPQTITVNKANQTITFNALTDKIVPANFTVSASASSGLPVSFSAGPIGTCTISGTNVSVTGVGACTITASQAGDSNYHPATSVPQSFNASYTFFGWLQPVDGDGTATGLVNWARSAGPIRSSGSSRMPQVP